MKNILITGGAGFIGSNLAKRLGNKKYNIFAFDNLHPQVHAKPGRPKMLPDFVTLLTGDVSYEKDWDSILKLVHPDAVIHLAAETGTGQSLTEATRHGNVNVVGTTAMIDALTRNNMVPEHILLSSTRAVYGQGAWKGSDGSLFYPNARSHDMLESAQWDFKDSFGKPASAVKSRADLTHPNPSNIYAATKLAQEHILSAWANAMRTKLSILRFQNVYGPGQSLYNSYASVVTLFSRLASAGKVAQVYEDGNLIRDYVYIEDVVSAIELALAKPPKDIRKLDVGTGAQISLLEAARIIAKTLDAPEPVVNGKYEYGDVRVAICDISQTTKELGYTPKWTTEAGLGELAKWVQQEVAKNGLL